MILGRIALDPTNVTIVGGMVGTVATIYGVRLSWRKQLDEHADNVLESIERERKQLDEHADNVLESVERERDYWKTEAELWRRRCMKLTEQEGSSKWPELD